jgi:hypothetical protein
MRAFRNRRVSVLATVTGVSLGIAGVLLFVRFGPSVGPETYDPAERANARSGAGDPRKPPAGMPSLPFPSWPGGRPGSSGPSPSGAPAVDAPTENLRRVVAALRFAYKSTTGVLIVPPGLNLTSTVEISMLWDEGSSRPTRATQNYNNATGNRSLFLFPAGDGRPRPVANVLSLRELGVEGAYTAVRSNVTIEPLYDVSVSPLTFTLEDDCDLAGDSEIVFRWRSPDAGVGKYEISMSEGQVRTVVDFKRTYQEVGRSANLQEPKVVYFEDDGALGGDFFGYPTEPTPPLVLGKDLVVDRGGYAVNDVQCGSRIQYSVTYRLREYLYLE